MEKEDLQRELIQNLEQRITVSDSMLDLTTLQADKWHQELIITDEKLEELEIEMEKMKRKSRVWKRIWFGVGVVSTTIFFLII